MYRPTQLMKAGALATGLLCGLCALPANAAPPAAPRVAVTFKDLDLDTERGAKILYRRLMAAAEAVCPEPYSHNLRLETEAKACRDQAFARAVRDLNMPRLTAVIPDGERERLNL